IVVGRSEVWVIEKIKELETNTQYHFVSTDKARVLHDSEVSIEIARIAETIASLRKGNSTARTRSLSTWQVPRIERGLAPGLYKQCARIWAPIGAHLQRPTRMREGWDYGSRSAGMGPAEWGNWHRVDCSIEIVRSQITAFCEIDHGIGKSGSGENRSRDLPSLHQVIGAAAVEHGLYRELPHIVRIEGVTNIVICRSVAAAQIKGILRVDRTACSEFGEAAVGDFIQRVAV